MQSALITDCFELLAATYLRYIRLVSVVPSYRTKRIYVYFMFNVGLRGGVVVKALRYKPAGRGFDSRWCHWNFSVA